MFASHLDLRHPLAWPVPGVLTDEECAYFVRRMLDAPDAEVAPVIGAEGEVVDPSLRNNTRILFFDTALASTLWTRVRPHVPAEMMGLTATGVNECFRIYRYAPGQHHSAHWDTPIELPDGRKSLLTFIMYLNEDFSGGVTSFDQIDMAFTPRRGLAVLFQHRVLHDAQSVVAGEKFVLRSEVFYAAGK